MQLTHHQQQWSQQEPQTGCGQLLQQLSMQLWMTEELLVQLHAGGRHAVF